MSEPAKRTKAATARKPGGPEAVAAKIIRLESQWIAKFFERPRERIDTILTALRTIDGESRELAKDLEGLQKLLAEWSQKLSEEAKRA